MSVAPASLPGDAGAAPSSAQVPPFAVPGRHFGAALGFLVLGAVALVPLGPALAAGAFADPRVVAATHLFTLGWIGTSILGALYQFVPVALGTSVRSLRLTEVTFWAWTPGVAVFAGGFLLGSATLTTAGAAAVGAAILLFAGNLGATLPRAPRRDLTWWCVAGATAFLLGAWVLGFLLAVNAHTDLLGPSRFTVLIVHLHLAAGGWVLLVVIGVAHRLLPMFLLSHGARELPGKAAAALVGAGAAGLLLSEHLLPTGAIRPALAVMAAGAGAFLLQTALWYRARRRPRLDPGLRLTAAGLVLLGAALAAGVAALAAGRPSPRLLTAYGLLLVPGGLGLFVAGHYYKILPFLTWFHRFGPVAAEREVPTVAELVHPRAAHAAGALLATGAAVLAGGALAGSAAACTAGATALAAGAALEAGQIVHIVTRRST